MYYVLSTSIPIWILKEYILTTTIKLYNVYLLQKIRYFNNKNNFQRHAVVCQTPRALWALNVEDLRLNRARQRLIFALISAFLITYILTDGALVNADIWIREARVYTSYKLRVIQSIRTWDKNHSSHSSSSRSCRASPAPPNNEDCFFAVYRDFGRKCRALSVVGVAVGIQKEKE